MLRSLITKCSNLWQSCKCMRWRGVGCVNLLLASCNMLIKLESGRNPKYLWDCATKCISSVEHLQLLCTSSSLFLLVLSAISLCRTLKKCLAQHFQCNDVFIASCNVNNNRNRNGNSKKERERQGKTNKEGRERERKRQGEIGRRWQSTSRNRNQHGNRK